MAHASGKAVGKSTWKQYRGRYGQPVRPNAEISDIVQKATMRSFPTKTYPALINDLLAYAIQHSPQIPADLRPKIKANWGGGQWPREQSRIPVEH